MNQQNFNLPKISQLKYTGMVFTNQISKSLTLLPRRCPLKERDSWGFKNYQCNVYSHVEFKPSSVLLIQEVPVKF